MIAEIMRGSKLGTISFPLLQSVPDEMARMAVEEGERLLEERMDDLPLSLYKAFRRTGSREVYETPFFRKRRRLSHLVIAEALERRGRFLDRIEDEIWSILGEPAWVIPAHNTYVRDTPQLLVPDTGHPVLDLFSMETSEILSLSYSILHDSLTPQLKLSIESEIGRRIIAPYLGSWFWWMGNDGKEKLNNWTVWCSQNMLLTILSLPVADDVRAEVVEKASVSIDDWYSQYSDDGCCDEGAQYWHAAPLCYFGCLALLDEASGGALSFMKEDRKLRAMASYIVNVHVAGDRYLNFADCSPCAGWLGAREYLFGQFTGNDELMRMAISDFRDQYSRALSEGHSVELFDNDYNLWYCYLEYGMSGELLEREMPPASPLPSFVRYDSVGLYIYRLGDMVLAVKGGCNDDSHNHNDVGSIILYKGIHPLLADIGVETYTLTTFSKDRYTLRPMQSLYHNVVNFDGTGQEAGAEFRAVDVKAGSDGVSMELCNAYPAGTVSSYIRSIRPADSSVEVSEIVSGAKRPVLSIITMDKPGYEDGTLAFDGWRIVLSGVADVSIEDIEITDKRLRIAWPDKLYRTLVSFTDRLDWTIML